MATRNDFIPIIIAYAACIAAGVLTLLGISAMDVDFSWQPALWPALAADVVATVVIFFLQPSV